VYGLVDEIRQRCPRKRWAGIHNPVQAIQHQYDSFKRLTPTTSEVFPGDKCRKPGYRDNADSRFRQAIYLMGLLGPQHTKQADIGGNNNMIKYLFEEIQLLRQDKRNQGGGINDCIHFCFIYLANSRLV
jgi:hypothetical protein